MRISELARRSGVSVFTIKYYLRVGLLPPGTTTAHNQASYGDEHLRRLRLIRVFVDIGGLTVMATRTALSAIEDTRVPGRELLALIGGARSGARRRALDGEIRDAALRDVAALLEQRGWRVQREGHGLDRLIDVCVAARLLEIRELCTVLDRYAGAAAELARCDVEVTRALAERIGGAAQEQRTAIREAVTAATLLGNAMAAALHGLARQDALGRLFDERSAIRPAARKPAGAGRPPPATQPRPRSPADR